MAARPSWPGRAGSAVRARRRDVAPDEYVEVVRAFGSDHPLARAVGAVSVATDRAVEASALLVAAPCLVVVGPEPAIAAEGSAALVTAILWAVVAVLRGRRRQRVHDLIVAGEPRRLPLILSESRRLVDRDRCSRVAATLDAALHAGEHWYEYLPASRPPAGVRHLPANGPLIRGIAARLREGPVSPRAMVMLDRLVRGGYGAAVYQGGGDWLRRELGRVRFELAESGGGEWAHTGHTGREAVPPPPV
jgi:hypothetical protein